MNRNKLERYLKSCGCVFQQRGGEHDIWCKPDEQRTSAIPRHREVNTFTMKSICKDLNVPPPREK